MADQEDRQQPVVGAWYQDPPDRRFEVASVDEESGLIQVRYEDGETGELALADWRHAMVDRDSMLDTLVNPPDAEEDR